MPSHHLVLGLHWLLTSFLFFSILISFQQIWWDWKSISHPHVIWESAEKEQKNWKTGISVTDVGGRAFEWPSRSNLRGNTNTKQIIEVFQKETLKAGKEWYFHKLVDGFEKQWEEANSLTDCQKNCGQQHLNPVQRPGWAMIWLDFYFAFPSSGWMLSFRDIPKYLLVVRNTYRNIKKWTKLPWICYLFLIYCTYGSVDALLTESGYDDQIWLVCKETDKKED